MAEALQTGKSQNGKGSLTSLSGFLTFYSIFEIVFECEK